MKCHQPHTMNNYFYTRIALLLFVLTPVAGFCTQQTANQPVSNGILDLRNTNFADKVPLAGEWFLYPGQLVNHPHQPSGKLTHFPQAVNQHTDPALNVATYTLTILLPTQNDKLSLEIPDIYCSYTLFANGTPIAHNGKPGTTPESTLPQWLPQVVPLETTSDTVVLTLHTANFYHYNSGAKQAIYLGRSALLDKQLQVKHTSNLVEFLVLAILGLSFVIIFYVRQEKKRITLYFALMCLSWAIRSVFSNQYLFTTHFPDVSWFVVVHIEYITLYLMLIWTVLFINKLFSHESNKIILYLTVGGNTVFTLATLLTSPLFFTQWLHVYLIVAGLVLVHSLVVTLRALVNERTGVWYLVFSIALGILLFTYDIFVHEGFFQTYHALLFSVGYIVIFLSVAIALLLHLNIFKNEGSGILTFDELYKPDKPVR